MGRHLRFEPARSQRTLWVSKGEVPTQVPGPSEALNLLHSLGPPARLYFMTLLSSDSPRVNDARPAVFALLNSRRIRRHWQFDERAACCQTQSGISTFLPGLQAVLTALLPVPGSRRCRFDFWVLPDKSHSPPPAAGTNQICCLRDAEKLDSITRMSHISPSGGLSNWKAHEAGNTIFRHCSTDSRLAPSSSCQPSCSLSWRLGETAESCALVNSPDCGPFFSAGCSKDLSS
jgi:hypothetical protein